MLEKLNALHLLVFDIFLSTAFPEYQRICSKKYFTDHQTAKSIQLFVAIKGNFSFLLFFWRRRSKVKFPRGLIDVATCLFALH